MIFPKAAILVTDRMFAGRTLCALALIAGVSGPLQANNPARECRTVAALGSGKANDLAKISLHFRRDGTIDLQTSGRPDSIIGANECEIGGPVEDLNLQCTWVLDSEQEARDFHRTLRDRIVSCMPLGFTSKQDNYATETYIVHLRELAEFEITEYESVDMKIDMVESIFQGVSRFRVRFEAERD